MVLMDWIVFCAEELLVCFSLGSVKSGLLPLYKYQKFATASTWDHTSHELLRPWIIFMIFGSDRSPRRGDVVRACVCPCVPFLK